MKLSFPPTIFPRNPVYCQGSAGAAHLRIFRFIRASRKRHSAGQRPPLEGYAWKKDIWVPPAERARKKRPDKLRPIQEGRRGLWPDSFTTRWKSNF